MGGPSWSMLVRLLVFWSRYDRSVALERGVDTMHRVSTCHVSDFRFQTWAVVEMLRVFHCALDGGL